ncbi:hypothetical protein V5J35_004373 [Endozoicomonas sp. NE40]|uniref:Uncharacterized protein n=1 Tax=Endozoicomonas lisbonensis TaxID=3120522 RepID=A0ABV2SPH1_9GAMM
MGNRKRSVGSVILCAYDSCFFEQHCFHKEPLVAVYVLMAACALMATCGCTLYLWLNYTIALVTHHAYLGAFNKITTVKDCPHIYGQIYALI